MGSDGAVMCSDGLCLEGGIGGWGEGMGGVEDGAASETARDIRNHSEQND